MMSNNPYKPGAAHTPPHLAGRDKEKREFIRLLGQSAILENLVLTGVRGIGKTVLLRESLQQEAVERGWLWVSSDISEAVSVSERNLAERLLADLNTFSGGWKYQVIEQTTIGFKPQRERQALPFDYNTMMALFEHEPGLTSDKIKKVLLTAWDLMREQAPQKKGVVFALDEAQNLADHNAKQEYPLGVLLDVFSSIQSQGVPFMLALTGLPTLFSKLVESRTYAERMFRVLDLKNLSESDTRDAILDPLTDKESWIQDTFSDLPPTVYEVTKGYPYFIQFWCRELYDYLIGTIGTESEEMRRGVELISRIRHKLDSDFFGARCSRLTDRQRDLLILIAHLDNSDGEFTVQDIVRRSKAMSRPFSGSNANQVLNILFNQGMVFRTRHGKYALAVPLLDEYIRRITPLQ